MISVLKKFLSNFINIYLVAALGSLLGFICQILIARNFGVSSAVDAYLISLAIPVFIASSVNSACSFGLIPKLTANLDDHTEFTHLVQSIYFLGFLISLLFALMIFLIPFQINYYQDLLKLNDNTLITLFRNGWIVGICQIFLSIGSSILNARSNYAISTSLTWFPYIGIIIFISAFNQNQSILNLSYGLMVGNIVGMILSIALISNIAFSNTSALFSKLHGHIFEIISISIKAIILGTIFISYFIIDSYWAPKLAEGIMSTLGYSQRVIGSIGALSIMGVFVITGKEAQSELSKNGISAFRKLSISFIKIGLIMSLILAMILFLFIEDIVRFLFASKNFSEQNIVSLATTIKLMLPGMVFMLLAAILTKLVLCLENILSHVCCMAILWPALYFSGIFLLFNLGITGFAISYSVTWIVIATLMLFFLLIRTRH